MSDKPDKKNTTIAQVYGEFFGSVADTLRDARKKDPTIKLQDVKDWFANNFVRTTNLPRLQLLHCQLRPPRIPDGPVLH